MRKRKSSSSAPRKAEWTPTDDVAKMTPAQIVKERREQLAMSQGELATRLGYSNSNFISMLEMGWSRLPLAKVQQVARALHLPEVWLMERTLAQRISQDGVGYYSFWFGPHGKVRRLFDDDLAAAARLLGR
jgi:transcriptional regulator with XRE-family HTH domain